MDHYIEDRFVASFVDPRERARVRRWLQEPSSRSRVLAKLPHGFMSFLDSRFIREDAANRELFGKRVQQVGGRVYHIAYNPRGDGRSLREDEFRRENGGYYDSFIAIVDPEHCAAYVMEDDSRWVVLLR